MVDGSVPILDLRNITVSFQGTRRRIGSGRPAGERLIAVKDVSLLLEKGTTLGLVGESGCGKTTLGRAAAGLQPIDRGTVLFEGKDLSGCNGRERRIARRRIQMIFQNPFASLNPRMTVFEAIAEAVRAGTRKQRPSSVRETVAACLEQVGLDAGMTGRFPHEFSGGQRQRIAIARALAADPTVIIADEPVSSLDVSVAAQVLNLLYELRDRLNLTMLFVSHDLSVVRYIAHFIAVMYRGRIVEYGPAGAVFSKPEHPYTAMLLKAVPVISVDPARPPFFEQAQQGAVAQEVTDGCSFAPRCAYATDRCRTEEPVLQACTDNKQRTCACLRTGEIHL